MSELTEVKNQQVAQIPTDQVELIKRTVAKGATDDELQMFLHLAQAYGLDPFAKEIWFIKRLKKVKIGESWDYPRLPNGDLDYSNCDAPVIMTSRDGYLKIAQRDEKFDGLISFPVRENDTFEIDAMNYTVIHKFGANRGKIIGAWAKCERKDCKPTITYVDFSEYNDLNSSVWKKYPSAMIQKVAEVFVLKRQFGISGLTTKEEMPAEYDMKNVSDQHTTPATLAHTENDIPQIPQQVGDYTITIKGSKTKLSEMSMKQLEWLKKSSKNETTRAMASAYIDEINHKGNEIEGEAVISDAVVNDSAAEKQLPVQNVSAVEDPTALFGGAAV